MTVYGRRPAKPGKMPDGAWKTGDADSRLLIDAAAGRSLEAGSALSDEGIVLAHQHGLLGLLATGPNGALGRGVLPAFSRLAARQQVMLEHLRRLLETFDRESIRATVLKGPDLASRIYRVPAHRTFTDIDVLVHPSDLEAALRLLARDPAVPSIPAQGPKADKRNIPISDPRGVRFTLDLHWDLFSYTQLHGAADGATESAWAETKGPNQTPLGPTWYLPEETLICFLGTHALLDHRFRLILFRDLTEVALREPDWEAVGRFAHRWGLRSSTYVALLMASKVTNAPVPPEFLSVLRPHTTPVRLTERLLASTDLVHFDGHRPHPLNLAIVLLHDSAAQRLRLAIRAPVAFPKWLRRVGRSPQMGVAISGPRRISDRRKRVLHLLAVDLARGAQTYAKALRDELDSAEVEHRTATIFRSEVGALQPDVDLAVDYGLGSRLGFSPRAMLRLRDHLRSWQPDVLVAHGGEALKYAAFASSRRTKLAYYKIGSAQERLRNPLRLAFHRLLVKRADLVAGVSKEMVEEAQDLLGARESRSAYIPNGRDPSLFRKVATPGGQAPVRFVFVGHLTQTKRAELFIDVVDAIRGRGVEAQGFVIGDGPLLNELQRSAPAWVEVMGRRDDVPTLLSECDVFLFTSVAEGEGMPGVLIEAGLAGLPVVSTEVPGARTVIDDGVTGYVVSIEDTSAFIEAAERLARRPELREAMGAAARARCLEHFTLQSSIELWRDHLEELVMPVGRAAKAR